MSSASETELQAREAIRCTWIGSIVDTLLGVAKIIIGTLFHSQSLIADGIHSLSDLATDVMVVGIIKVARTEPDKEHPYGHERFETLGTVFLGFLLVAVAGAMAYESIYSFYENQDKAIPGWPTLIVALISVISKEWIFRYTVAVGKRIKSDLLIANAWHSRSDAYSSIVVLIGIAGAMAGFTWLDTVAAIVVALFVAKIGWDLSWSSLRELVDTAIPQDLTQEIRQAALSVEGIEDVHSFKSRQMGQKILLEMHLQVKPYLTASEGHYLGDAVVAKLLQQFDSIGHVIFHIDTENDDIKRSCMVLPFRAEITDIIDQQLLLLDPNLIRQNINLHYLHGRVEIDLMIAPLPEKPQALDELARQELGEKLNAAMAQYNWFQHLTLWIEL